MRSIDGEVFPAAAHGQAVLHTTSQSRRKLLASSPSRGASGETVHFAGTAKASPTRRGGIASAMTERLYEGEPDLFHAKRPLHFCNGPFFLRNRRGDVSRIS